MNNNQKRKYTVKHNWEIKLLNPITREVMDIDICDRIEKSKFINENIKRSKLINYCYRPAKNGLFEINKIPVQTNPIE